MSSVQPSSSADPLSAVGPEDSSGPPSRRNVLVQLVAAAISFVIVAVPATLGGLFFLDVGAESDDTARRRSTFLNAHNRLKLFTGRNDPGGRDEQYEHLYILLLESCATFANYRVFCVGDPDNEVPLDRALEDLLKATAVRNPDFYEYDNGVLRTAS